jgi:chemotaxis regulatin CheY-phosphate phosphatase CheZ
MNNLNPLHHINSQIESQPKEQPVLIQTLSPPSELTNNAEMLNRIGHVTRMLHDSLSGLGLSKILEQVAVDIPNARDRLNYVARMTEQAVERVLNTTAVAFLRKQRCL